MKVRKRTRERKKKKMALSLGWGERQQRILQEVVLKRAVSVPPLPAGWKSHNGVAAAATPCEMLLHHPEQGEALSPPSLEAWSVKGFELQNPFFKCEGADGCEKDSVWEGMGGDGEGWGGLGLPFLICFILQGTSVEPQMLYGTKFGSY